MNKAYVAVIASLALISGTLTIAAEDQNPGHLKMALVCMKSLYSDSADASANAANLQTNLKRHLDFIDRVAADGAEFVGFPELSLNGYHFSAHMSWLSLTGPEVETLKKKAAEKRLYVSAGMAERDEAGKKWNTQILIGPDGRLLGRHHKIWLTAEKGHTEIGTEHNVFDVKGAKLGIGICADNSDYNNLQALADKGAQIVYAPHANNTGGTLAGWYKFRARWGGSADPQMTPGQTSNEGPAAPMPAKGWVARVKVYAALHNNAGLYNPDYNPPVDKDANNRFASGAWFIGPDGSTLAQIPSSTKSSDSKEYILMYNVPIGETNR